MKRAAVLFFAFLGSGSAFGQVEFQKTAGGASRDYAYSIITMADGGYLVASQTEQPDPGRTDICLIRLNASGDTLWSRIWGDTGSWEIPSKIIELPNGDIALCGAWNNDILLMRLDASGNPLWTKKYGGSLLDDARAFLATSDGGYIMVGSSTSYCAENVDLYVIKTDSLGDTLWTASFGGYYIESGNAVTETPQGGFLIAGYAKLAANVSGDIYLLRLDAQGQLTWSKRFGGIGNDYVNAILNTADGGCFIAGSSDSTGNGNTNFFLTRRDLQGNEMWTRHYGGNMPDNCYEMLRCADGGLALCGHTLGFGSGGLDGMLLKTDSAGTLLWSKTYGGNLDDMFYSAARTAGNGFIMAGSTAVNTVDYNTIYIVKTDSLGNTPCNMTVPAVQSSVINWQSFPLSSVRGYGGAQNPESLSFLGNISCATLCSTVGMNQPGLQEENLAVYPNPTTPQQVLHIPLSEFTTGSAVTLRLHDITGRVLAEFQYEVQASSLPLVARWPAGLYTISVSQEGVQPRYAKWVIR
ncbi:MAG: lipoprotein [Bacteroidetes bacterium]|nr:MAG: lipoprotein [Bacteroidota bacterium]